MVRRLHALLAFLPRVALSCSQLSPGRVCPLETQDSQGRGWMDGARSSAGVQVTLNEVPGEAQEGWGGTGREGLGGHRPGGATVSARRDCSWVWGDLQGGEERGAVGRGPS